MASDAEADVRGVKGVRGCQQKMEQNEQQVLPAHGARWTLGHMELDGAHGTQLPVTLTSEFALR